MEKVEVSGTVISLDIFRCSVLVLVGKDEEDIITSLPKIYKTLGLEDADKSIELIKKDHCKEDDCGLYVSYQ